MKSRLLLLFIFTFCSSEAQTYFGDLDVYTFTIKNDTDTIDIIKTGKDLDTAKPTMIFCQGSLPIPLIIEFREGMRSVAVLNNFNYHEISKKYNIVLISMPFTPLMVKEDSLNNQYAYVTDPNIPYSFSKDYLDANYMETYVRRGDAVIDFLMEQKWVDKNNLFIVGHSQGAKVATKIAATNKDIVALGFFGGNPLGRVDQFIRESRALEAKGTLSKEESQARINEIYKWWEKLHEDAEVQLGEDSPKTTISFSEPVLSDLLNLKIPVFVAYGTSDISSSYCDLLPIDFIRVGKLNYKHNPYLGLEHNFFEVNEDDRPIYDKGHWDDVMSDFFTWIEQIQKERN